ncbi:MAG: S8 family peptidase, partial [Nanoarchaeota archaeon]
MLYKANKVLSLVLILLCAMVLISSTVLGSDKLNDRTKDYLKYVKYKTQVNEYIIRFHDSVDNSKLDKVSIKKEYKNLKSVKVKANVNEIEELIQDGAIKYIELDQNIEILSDNMPYGIEKTNAVSVWNITKGSGVKVAILDTGISDHDDLSIAGGYSVVSDDYSDYVGHGTAVAGVLAAIMDDNGIVGVAPEADVYAVKIMNGSTGELSDAIEAVEWCIDNDIDIISMSFGMETYSQIFKEVLEEAYSSGILIIAAAGNGGDVLYPAAYSGVIAVGAVDSSDEIASFSSHGNEIELVAAGVDVNSTSLDNDYSLFSGTSFAAPHVAGVAALLKSWNNSLTNSEIRFKLRNDALDLGDEGKDDYYGYGLVKVNLESGDYTLENESYFYEIFNITGYGTSEESFDFWLNGTGTVDDVEFNEGIYSVKEYLSSNILTKIIYVDDLGILSVLTEDLDYDDNYTYNCSSNSDDDGIVWIDGELDVEIYWDGGTILAECFDWENDGYADNCYGFQGNIDECRVVSSFDDWCTEADPDCETSGSIGEHTLSTAVSKTEAVSSRFCYYNYGWGYDTEYQIKYYSVCNERQYICQNDTHYKDRCITLASYNRTFGTYQCNEGYYCDSTQDEDNADFGTDGTTKPQNPCRPITGYCNGSIEIIVTDSNNWFMGGSYIYLNSIFNATTSNNHSSLLNLNNIACGANQNITVNCSSEYNQSRVCDSGTFSLDFNGDNDSLIFDCNKCKDETNLKIGADDVKISFESGTTYNLSVEVQVENIEQDNVNITFIGQNKNTGLFSEHESILVDINRENVNASVLMDLNNINFLHIYVDPKKDVNEPKDDNYLLIPVVKKKLKANLSINTGYSEVNDVIKSYLKFFIDDVSQSQTDVVIAVGKNTNEANAYSSLTLGLDSNSFGKEKRQIKVNDDYLNKPYTGLVGTYAPSSLGKTVVFIYGNRIEGTVAALKEFISARDVFLSENTYSNFDNVKSRKLVILDDYDTTGLGVMDLMHNAENGPYYLQNSDAFANVVYDILNDNNYEISIKTVKTVNDNTTLRLKHVNSDYSDSFKDAVVGSSKPVVLSRGIHSNLFTWNDFATELASDKNNARDTWLIEMVGGPEQDENCGSDCPNYTFSDLKTYYWPALIAGVEEYSGQNTIDYVGYSLGCSAALESLELYGDSGKNNAGYCFNYVSGEYDIDCDLASDPVDTFVAVACP